MIAFIKMISRDTIPDHTQYCTTHMLLLKCQVDLLEGQHITGE